MDSAINRHIATATDFSQNNSTQTSLRDTSNPDSLARTQQMITKSSIEAHFAKIACEQSSSFNSSDRARNVYVNRQLVSKFVYKFGTTESYAEAAVEQEMKRYAPNPWDAPDPRRSERLRRRKMGRNVWGGGTGWTGGMVQGTARLNGTLFERLIGYK